MEIDTLYDSHKARLEDFWSRRQNRPRFVRKAELFDRTVVLHSNYEPVLAAVDTCLPQYSKAYQAGLPEFAIQIVVHAVPQNPGAAPDDLIDSRNRSVS